MQPGEVIRKYRKSRNLTQEEMAGRLGVTASAVNKWENGNSYPDIMLLGPIARLLDISLDTLLSFSRELTAEEVNEIIYEMDTILKERSYDEAFRWARKKLEQYPDCGNLIWQTALILDVQRSVKKVPDAEKYDEYLYSLYKRAMECEDETVRYHAADALFGFYMRKEQYKEAEECLKHFPAQDPLRKIKQAQLYEAAGNRGEAYKTYEEFLFSSYQALNGSLLAIYRLALEERDMEKAHMLADKQKELAKCFEMGRSCGLSARLELAATEKDGETVIRIMREMLSEVRRPDDFSRSPLYEHMSFKEPRKEFLDEMEKNLLAAFQDEKTFGFLKNDKRWQELVE